MTPVEVETRELLLQTAEAILDAGEVHDLGLRELARQAGLSHNAPLRHFESLTALRTQVAIRAFHDFGARTADAASPRTGSETALERAVRAGQAYVGFATEQPGRFALMWRFDLIDRTDEFLEVSLAAYGVLDDIVGEAQRAGHRPDVDRGRLAAIVWSTLHGIATLHPRESFDHTSGPQPTDDLVRDAMSLILGSPTSTHSPSPSSHRRRP
jgi:AcrR family transcriptional regulator